MGDGGCRALVAMETKHAEGRGAPTGLSPQSSPVKHGEGEERAWPWERDAWGLQGGLSCQWSGFSLSLTEKKGSGTRLACVRVQGLQGPVALNRSLPPSAPQSPHL